MTKREDIRPPVRPRMRNSNRDISELSRDFDKVIESAPLSSSASRAEETQGNQERQGKPEGGDLLNGDPKYSANDVINKSSDVAAEYSESAARKSSFMLYLNNFEKAAICLVMEAYEIDSMNDLVREYGIYRVVDVAIEKLGFTEEACEEFYKNNKHDQFAKKKSRTRRRKSS